MRIFYWFLVGSAILALVGQTQAQDSLNYSTNSLTLPQSTTIASSTSDKWRLSGFVGYHQQFQSGYLNESLYLTHGLHASLTTDYFIGRNWGIGVLIGYQNLAVSDLYRQDPSIPKYPSARILPLTSLHSFMLTAGPAFSFPITRQFILDIDLRGGVFYNDAPILGAYQISSNLDNLLTGTLISTTITPSSQRVRLGFNGFVALKYQFTQQLSMGLAASSSYTSFGYTQMNTTNFFAQKRVDLTMFGIQATVSYRFAPAAQRARTAPPVPPTPVCYPPLLDPAAPNLYEVGAVDQPIFKWRSSAPVYTEGERYTFRLYTLPGNRLLYEKVVQEPQLVWPAQVALPDTNSYYFYTVHTSRSDEFDQSCRSEPVVGTLGFFKPRTSSQSQAATPKEPVQLFRLRLYVLDSTLITQVSNQPIKTEKQSRKTTRRPKTSRIQPPVSQTLAPADSSKSIQKDSVLAVGKDSSQFVRKDSVLLVGKDSSQSVRKDSVQFVRKDSSRTVRKDSLQSVARIVPRLIYEGPTQHPTFVWPSSVTLPTQPTVYQYVINRISNRELIQNYYLMVEPDGCHTIISETTKNTYLPNRIVTGEQSKPGPAPTNKGQP